MHEISCSLITTFLSFILSCPEWIKSMFLRFSKAIKFLLEVAFTAYILTLVLWVKKSEKGFEMFQVAPLLWNKFYLQCSAAGTRGHTDAQLENLYLVLNVLTPSVLFHHNCRTSGSVCRVLFNMRDFFMLLFLFFISYEWEVWCVY